MSELSWERKCDLEVGSQLLLNQLKRKGKLSKKQEKIIQRKITLMGLMNLLEAPHIKGNYELERKVKGMIRETTEEGKDE
jgi:hypothetical protein